MACMVPGNSIHYILWAHSSHFRDVETKACFSVELAWVSIREGEVGFWTRSITFQSPITFPQGDVRGDPPFSLVSSFLFFLMYTFYYFSWLALFWALFRLRTCYLLSNLAELSWFEDTRHTLLTCLPHILTYFSLWNSVPPPPHLPQTPTPVYQNYLFDKTSWATSQSWLLQQSNTLGNMS